MEYEVDMSTLLEDLKALIEADTNVLMKDQALVVWGKLISGDKMSLSQLQV